MHWPLRRSVDGPTCDHYSHRLLKRCGRPGYGGRELCEIHLARCWDGCAPVRFVWWGPGTVGYGWRFRWDWTDDDYGNPGVLVKFPFSGVLAFYYTRGALVSEYWYVEPDEVDENESLGD